MKMHFLSLVLLCCMFAAAPLIGGEIKGTVTARGMRSNADAVVYIDDVAGKKFEPPAKHPVMDQKNLMFEPHVLPVLAGTTVDFLNSDNVLHNVYSPAKCAESFNLGSWPKGKTKSYTFKSPDCFAVLLCNVHPEMEAYVVVLKTPYYAVSDKNGEFVIKDVPPGKYTLKVWHEKLKAAPVEIQVSEKGTVTQNFTLGR